MRPTRIPGPDPEKRERFRRLAASVEGLDGPSAYEILAPEGHWPGSTDPAKVERVLVEYHEDDDLPPDGRAATLHLVMRPTGEA